jgi:hypothetical protein
LAKKHKLENRFRKGSQLSERMFLKVIYYWLSGATISSIPSLALAKHGAADEALKRINSNIPPFNFPEESGETLSRQSVHSVVNYVADFIICAAYVDQRDSALFDNVHSAFDGHKSTSRYKRLTEGMSAAEIRSFEIENALKTIEEFKDNWGLIIHLFSADKIPYKILHIMGLGDFEKAANPLLIKMMRDRYKRFRGYNRKAMDSHIGLYFAWQYGLNQIRGNHGMPSQEFFLSERNIEDQGKFFDDITREALLVLMLMLMWDHTYDDLIRRFAPETLHE